MTISPWTRLPTRVGRESRVPWAGRGDRGARVHVDLAGARATLRRFDHDPFARMDGDATPRPRSLTPVGLDGSEERDPLVFRSHAMQPIAAVGDGNLADRGADLGLGRGGGERTAPFRFR